MTVVSSSSTITFAGDGVQNMFDFNFRIFKENDLSAVVRSGGIDEIKLAPGSDFKIVSGIGNEAGGRVQYPVSGEPLPSGESITFYRTISYSQELELVDNDPFSASLLNEAFDRGVMRDQQLQEQLDRALKYDISTPAEEVLTPQVFMQRVTDSRDSAASALFGAVQARDDALLAQTAAQTAQAGAEAAQNAAESARDSAARIAFEDLAALRSVTPILSGPAEAPHGTLVTIEITDHINDAETSYDLNVSGFGEAAVSSGSIKWKLGSLDADAFHILEVVRRRRGEVYSETAQYQINVRYVPIQDGPTAVFADTAEGWPHAVVDTDGVHAPAYSVGADNEKQIVSAQMEIALADAERTLLSGSTAAALKLAEEVLPGDVLLTDLGECVVAGASGSEGNYTVTLVTALSGVPTEVFKKPSGIELKLGVGAAGEYVGPEVPLKFKGSNILPVMTGETTDGVTITAEPTGYPNANLVGWKVSDGNIVGRTSLEDWYDAEPVSDTGVITFDFNGVVQENVFKYVIYTFTDQNYVDSYQFRDWTLEAYNEDGQWVTVDEHTNVNSWTPSECKEFAAYFPKFTKLRLTITNTAVTNNAVGLVEIEFHKAGSSTEIELVSAESIKDKIFVEGGFYNKLNFDGNEVPVTGVSEEFVEHPGTIWEGTATSGVSSGVNKTNIPYEALLPVGTTFNKLGVMMTSDMVAAVGVVKRTTTSSPPSFQVVAKSALIPPADGMQYIDCSYTVIDDSAEYYACCFIESGNIPYRAATSCYMEAAPGLDVDLEVGDSFNTTINNVSVQLAYKTELNYFQTTATLATPLAQAPITASIPDRCTLSPAVLTAQIDSGELKITADMIELAEEPNLKRLAMAVIGAEDMRFKSGKIYIKEKP
ncbi:hypothetical protein [Maridesulfovibrio zosterae]|uniref:hypothetical protein n=1 Tax=Maridesulfovibrio zosterae TaxID=82171 RepID=UPI0004068C8D|nr:hypothetical protein [Maridesulfovibrio zosterae]